MSARTSSSIIAAALMVTATSLGGLAPALAISRSPSLMSPAPASTVPAAADVLTYRGSAERDGVMPGPGPVGDATVAWVFEASGPFASQPMVKDGVVYAVSSEGTLHAIDLVTGMELWNLALGVDATGSPLVLEDHVLVATNNGLHAISMADGSAVWTTPAMQPLKGSPVLTGGHVVVAAEDGSVNAVDPATGAILWTTSIGAGVDTSSAASADMVIVGTQTGQVVALSTVDGAIRWRTDTGDHARIGTPAINDGRVYIATLDGGGPDSNHIRALDLATGTVLWTFDSPDSVPSYTPAIVDGMAITEGESGAVTALDAATGTLTWQTHVPGFVEIVPSVADSAVYGVSNDTQAYALDVETGAPLWEVPIRGIPYGSALTGGLMLVGTDVGRLYAIRGDQS